MAVIWNQIQDQEETKNALMGANKRGHLAHALLFSGASAEINRKMALGFAQVISCEAAQKPCGNCGGCRRIELEQSENLILISPEPNVIKIEKIRELRETLSLQSWRGRRVVVIEQAHTLNPQAANALLKSLEEPPDATYFFLLTTHERSLMPTIRSRSQVVRVVAPLDEALDWGEEEQLVQSFHVWTELSKGAHLRGDDAIKALFASKDQALETIRIWTLILHRARRAAAGKPLNVSADQSVLSVLNQNPGAIDRCWQALLGMKVEIEGQVDRLLAVDSFLAHASLGFRQ